MAQLQSIGALIRVLEQRFMLIKEGMHTDIPIFRVGRKSPYPISDIREPSRLHGL